MLEKEVEISISGDEVREEDYAMSIVTLKCGACPYQVKKHLANWNDNALCPRCNSKMTAEVTMQVTVPQQPVQQQQQQVQVQQFPKINADAAIRAAVAEATAQSAMRQSTVSMSMSSVPAQLSQLQPVQLQPQPQTQTVTVMSQQPSAQIPPVQLPLQPLPPQQTVQTHLQQLQPQPPTAQPVLDLQLKNVVQQVVTGTKSSPRGTTIELRPPPEVFMSLQPVSPQQLAASPGGSVSVSVQRQPVAQVTAVSLPKIQLPQHPLPVAQAVAQAPSPASTVTVTTIDIQSQLQNLQPIPQAVIVNSVPAAEVGGRGQGKGHLHFLHNRFFFNFVNHPSFR